MGMEKTPKRHLKNKKVICSYYHFDFDKFGRERKRKFLQFRSIC